MIPENKTSAVSRALRQAFGVWEFEDIRPLTAGLSSALIFRILVKGRPYLLRVITRTDAMADPSRQFASARSAAEAGLAPRLWYASVEDRVLITDFIEARPFPRGEALVRLPAVLRAVHALPPFPKPSTFGHFLDVVDRFVEKFRSVKILPENETAELFELYARVAAVYPRDASERVSCHNDLKPENILFDGRRVWLVDWEAAFLNDRYLDLSVVANFVATSAAEESALLEAYFGEAPGEYRLARFYLMRQVAHMSYATVFLLLGSSGLPIDAAAAVPDFRDFHDRVWKGEISLASNAMRVAYGRLHLRQLFQNMRSPRFADALGIVSAATRGIGRP